MAALTRSTPPTQEPEPIPVRFRQAILAAAVATLTALSLPYLFTSLDERSGDWLLPLTGQAQPPQGLILVDIDEASLALVGSWPWPRATLARMVTELRRLGASHQYWDLFFPEPKPDDAALAAVLGPDITLGVVPVLDPEVTDPPRVGALPPVPNATTCPPDAPDARGYLALAPTLAQAPNPPFVGHLAPVFDPDGTLRRLPLLVCIDGTPVPTLTLANGATEYPPAKLQRLPWRFSPQALPALPAALLLSGNLPEGYLANQTVLVGATALGVADRVSTPFGPITPGVAVHAQILAAQLARIPLPQPLPKTLLSGIVAMLALFVALLPAPLSHRALILSATAPLPPLLHLLLLPHGHWLPPVSPGVALLAASAALFTYHAFQLGKERRRLTAHLAALLPKELAARVAAELPTNSLTVAAHAYTVVAATARNFDLLERRMGAQAATLALHTLVATARPIAERYGAQLYPAPRPETLLIAWPHRPTPQTVHALLTELLPALHHAVTPLPQPEEAPLALTAGVAHATALIGFIGDARRRIPILFGPAVRRAESLAFLAHEYAVSVLADSALLPSSAHPIGSVLLENEPTPFSLAALITNPAPELHPLSAQSLNAAP